MIITHHTHTLTPEQITAFATLSGDYNPIHLDANFASKTAFKKPVAHGMYIFSLIADLIEQSLPHHRYCDLKIMFPAPARVGDNLTTTITQGGNRVMFECLVHETSLPCLRGTARLVRKDAL